MTEAAALFVVRTDEAAFREVLPGLAYAPSNGEFARRFPADAPQLARIYSNFERTIEQVLEQSANRRPVLWEEALSDLAARLDGSGVEWFLCGSAALAARGIEVAPRDIDFVTTDQERVRKALADALIEPPLYDVDRGWIAAWFGRAYVGARVEWVADVYPDFDAWGAPSEVGPQSAARLERVRWNGRDLLLSPLDVQLAVNEKRGLADRVEAIRLFGAEGDAADRPGG